MSNEVLLLVDDERSVVEALEIFLEGEGFDVLSAHSGAEGLELFVRKRPQYVITDLKMPKMSGLELTGEIRKVDENVPVVILTGYGTLESAIDAIRLNVFDFVTKPVDVDVLKDILDRARDARRAAQAVQQELKRMREEVEGLMEHLSRQHQQLIKAEPLIQSGKMVMGLMHELNSPLTYIMGVSELLNLMHPDMDKIKAIHDQAIRMNRIISSVTGRIKNTIPKQRRKVQLNDLLREEVGFLQMTPVLKSKIFVKWLTEPNLPEVLVCPADLSQIFGNLLRNAVEAMHELDTKRITISSWHDSEGVHVSIQDAGPGIPDKLRSKIFEPFFSTKSGISESYGGLGIGIGLYHCRQLIQGYGGAIKCRNGEDEGAVFEVMLPPEVISLPETLS